MGALYHDSGIHAVNEILSALLLLSTPLLPILLAFPPLRSCIPHPCYIALLPAIILLAVPLPVSVELPWLLFGSGLGADESCRWLLVMSVVIWTAAMTLLPANGNHAADNRFTVFFLLTMAGNLGAIVATDVVGFFSFSALMGYAFYGLLIARGDETSRRAGRIYISFMIAADLLLFEVLLIAASITSDMGFESVRLAVYGSPSQGLYVSLVLAGFALKAGFWPFHSWLPLAFRSVRPPVAVLMGGVPIAMGLLGTLRWLPLGEITLPGMGSIIQLLGMAGILYAIAAGVKRAQLKLLPAYAVMIATGFFAVFLGAWLADPAVWNQYGNMAYLFIVSLGLGVVVVVAAINWLQTNCHAPATLVKQEDDSSLWIERCAGAVVRWGREIGFETLPRLRSSWMALADSLLQIRAWRTAVDAAEYSLQRWILAITLFLLLGVVIAFLAAI
jgi:formate hydrogenlyase subunit 3/multisubunit Na+/H+ antiporter MnhD subunit